SDLPFLILPLVIFSSAPLSKKEIDLTLKAFLMGCLINTAWCLYYSFGLHNNEIGRNTSRFMSHIRLGLYLNIAILTCAYFLSLAKSQLHKGGWLVLALYFVLVLYLLGLATGLLILSILIVIAGLYGISRIRLVYKLLLLVFFGTAFWFTVDYVRDAYVQQVRLRKDPNNKVL